MAMNLNQLAAGKLRNIEVRIEALNDTVFIRQISLNDIEEVIELEGEERAKELTRIALTDSADTECTLELVDQIYGNNNQLVAKEIQEAILKVNGYGVVSGES